MEVFKADNVHEAVTLAKRFRQLGRYDWFRGQNREWELISSFLRLDEPNQDKAIERMRRFMNWLQITPALKHLLQNRDAAFAVAQHYGFPTNYIDFTVDPKVAAFFATDSKSDNDDACILCLSIPDLKAFWKDIPHQDQYPPPDFIDIDVSNLW